MAPNPDRNRSGVVVRDSSENLEDILRAVLTGTDYGFLLTNLEHVAIACNAEFGRLFSLPIAKVVQHDVAAVRKMVRNRIVELDAWEKNLDEVYADPHRVQVDELVLQNPHTRLRRYTGPVLSRDGTPIARLWTFLDITAEARMRKVRESLTEASLFFDSEPRKVYEYLVELLGDHYGSVTVLSVREGDFLKFQAVGGPNEQARALEGNQMDDSYCQFCIQARSPLIIQDAREDDLYAHVLPARFGLTRYAGVPIVSPSGEIVGTLCILDDRSDELLDNEDLRFLSLIAVRISYELDRENQIRSLEGDLEATGEALRSMQHKLIQSEKLAVTGMLSASISHDIRNILSAISMEMSILADRPDELLGVVRNQLDRFAVLSHRLLSYARPNEVALAPVDLSEVLVDVLDLLRGHLAVSGITVESKMPKNLPSVFADPIRLQHLFVNLIMNAIQASQTGNQIRIRCQSHKDSLTVEIKDMGRGMTPHQLARLFEPFSSTRIGGFGLGLYSCRQIVRETGGEITATSKPGSGTLFKITLPLAP